MSETSGAHGETNGAHGDTNGAHGDTIAAPGETAPPPGGTGEDSAELKGWIESILLGAMAGESHCEGCSDTTCLGKKTTPAQVTAASAAIRYLAVKARLPQNWGEGFDE